MDESKRPIGYVEEPDLQGIQPLSYEGDKTKRLSAPKPERYMQKQSFRRPVYAEARVSSTAGDTHREPRESPWSRRGPPNRRRVWVNGGS